MFSHKNEDSKQGNLYDKILRENLEATLPVIISDLLGLAIVHSEELTDGIQHTKERKPDALRKVIDTDGNVFVLQIEFQAGMTAIWFFGWPNITSCC